MAENTSGLYRLLQVPWVYELVQTIFGAQSGRAQFANQYVSAKPGDRVIDVGCGPGELIRFLPSVAYVGYEPNPDYVQRARSNFPAASFHAKIFEEADLHQHELFDIAIVSAVLHHMDDHEAEMLFRLLKRALKPTGRVVTSDPVYVDDQNPIARFFISRDRGRNVRTPDGYRGLAEGIFDSRTGEVIHFSWPPYTRWVMICQ